MGERAPLPPPTPIEDLPALEPRQRARVTAPLRLHRYRPLFSGAAVERMPELQFQRPAPEIELARADAESRGIATGDEVVVSLERHVGRAARAPQRARSRPGVARIAEEHAGALPAGRRGDERA